MNLALSPGKRKKRERLVRRVPEDVTNVFNERIEINDGVRLMEAFNDHFIKRRGAMKNKICRVRARETCQSAISILPGIVVSRP